MLPNGLIPGRGKRCLYNPLLCVCVCVYMYIYIYIYIYIIYTMSQLTQLCKEQRLERHVSTYTVIIRLAKTYAILLQGCCMHLGSQTAYINCRGYGLCLKCIVTNYCKHIYVYDWVEYMRMAQYPQRSTRPTHMLHPVIYIDVFTVISYNTL
jgi:hypothetical protein